MKKIMFRIFAAVFLLSTALMPLVGCTSRANTLRIFNWGDYMDETVVDSFKEWYKEEYGKKIKVVYKEFTSNEELYTAIATKGEDWDLACPSEYTVDKLMENGHLQPVDSSVTAMTRDLVSEYLLDITDAYDNGSLYSVPYIWGTFGIMYDTEQIPEGDREELKSWAALWNPKYDNQIYMKTQERDSYTVALLYHYREELKAASLNFTDYETDAYKKLLKNIFSKFDDEELAKAKTALQAQKPLKYEADDGKMEMAQGNKGKLGLFWSCDAGFAMNDYELSGGYVESGNKKLGYVVPDEGSNVWVDSWVIPKTAKNTSAANDFLKFLYKDEISKLNASYAGASTANEEAMTGEDGLKAEIEDDEEFFEGTYEGFKEMYLEMMFPTPEILNRCAVMSDFGSTFAIKVMEMFQTIKMTK